VLAQVASALGIPAIIIELRVFEYREELASRGRSINRPSSQVALCDLALSSPYSARIVTIAAFVASKLRQLRPRSHQIARSLWRVRTCAGGACGLRRAARGH